MHHHWTMIILQVTRQHIWYRLYLRLQVKNPRKWLESEREVKMSENSFYKSPATSELSKEHFRRWEIYSNPRRMSLSRFKSFLKFLYYSTIFRVTKWLRMWVPQNQQPSFSFATKIPSVNKLILIISELPVYSWRSMWWLSSYKIS